MELFSETLILHIITFSQSNIYIYILMHAHWKIPFACIQWISTKVFGIKTQCFFFFLFRSSAGVFMWNRTRFCSIRVRQRLGSVPCSLLMLQNSFTSSVERMCQSGQNQQRLQSQIKMKRWQLWRVWWYMFLFRLSADRRGIGCLEGWRLRRVCEWCVLFSLNLVRKPV